MADASIKRGADRAARGIWGNFVVPAFMGACITAFFFQFVPEMMGVLHDNITWEQAFPIAWENFSHPYKNFIGTDGNPGDLGLLGWPAVGAVAGIFLTKIFTSLDS